MYDTQATILHNLRQKSIKYCVLLTPYILQNAREDIEALYNVECMLMVLIYNNVSFEIFNSRILMERDG